MSTQVLSPSTLSPATVRRVGSLILRMHFESIHQSLPSSSGLVAIVRSRTSIPDTVHDVTEQRAWSELLAASLVVGANFTLELYQINSVGSFNEYSV